MEDEGFYELLHHGGSECRCESEPEIAHEEVAPLPRLPQEIIDHIVGYVDDAKTLASCCLTGSPFLHTSLKVLFSHIRLNARTFIRIRDQIRSSAYKASCVRHVELCGFINPPMPVSYTAGQFTEIFTHVHNVQQVSFTRVLCQVPLGHNLFAPSVTTVALNTVHVNLLSELLYILRAFPNVTNITLANTVWTTSDIDTVQACRGSLQFTNLRKLDLQATGSAIQKLLFPGDGPLRLDTVALEARMTEDESWSPLLERVSEGIQHLTIHKCWQYRTANPFLARNLRNLRSLTLHTIWIVPHSQYLPTQKWLPGLLKTISPSLQDITFQIHDFEHSDLASTPFSEIDTILGDDSRFPELRSVTFEFVGSPFSEKDLVRIVNNEIRRLNTLGLVFVTVGKD